MTRGRLFANRYLIALGVLVILSTARAVLMLAAPPRPIDANQVFFRLGIDGLSWLVLAVPALWLAQQVPIQQRSWFWAVPLHIAAAVVFMLVQTTATLQLASRVVAPINLQFAVVLYGQSQVNFLTYWAIILAAHGAAYAQRYRERERRAAQLELQQAQLEAQLARAQLHALQTQLQPHFLFNTLNAVTAFIQSEPDRAERMLTGLGELLRGVLEASRNSVHPLHDELAFTQRYLAIQQERFGDRLKVHTSVADEALSALVPTLLLQPIVENAVQHGVAARAGGRINIETARAGDALEIRVRDAGAGHHSASAGGLGLGLANTRARLVQLYGQAHALETLVAGEGFEVLVRIPWQTLA